MVALTGDVHHMTLGTSDQRRMPAGMTEVTSCLRFVEIVSSRGITPTIYVSGKAAEEETAPLSTLYHAYHPEIGGHTYYCYRPFLAYQLSRRLLKLANGPSLLQRFDVAKTLRALRRVSPDPVVSWRNHAYRQDRNTHAILARFGVLSVSNQVGPSTVPTVITSRFGRLAILPINTPPDHENLHADPGYAGASPFRTAAEWCEETLRQVAHNERTGVPSVILAHPACMALEDGMSTLETLAAGLSRYQCVTMRKLAEVVLNS